MNKLLDFGLIFLTGSIYRERHTFSGNLLQLPQTRPISVKGSAKNGAERLLKLPIELFNPKIQKEEVVIDTTVREKTSPIPPIPNWPKKSLTPAGTLRFRKGFLKTELFESYPQLLRQASNRKSPQQKKARKATGTANHRSCPDS